MQKRIFITGGSGFLGCAITSALLERGDEVTVLSRDAVATRRKLAGGFDYIVGDPTLKGDWQAAVRGASAVVNLAGAPIDGKRWNAHYRQILHDSRVDTTRFVVEAISAVPESERPRVLVSSSGVDYYPFSIDFNYKIVKTGFSLLVVFKKIFGCIPTHDSLTPGDFFTSTKESHYCDESGHKEK